MSNQALNNIPVICLMGPSAVGKTALGIRIAEQFPCEIISVDSAMVYKKLDIGTAKPTAAEQKAIPHHLIDIRNVTEIYSAADFQTDANRLITEIRAKNKIPLLVGGTMLYFKALQSGLALMPPANPALRQELQLQLEQHGASLMHSRLQVVDPLAAQRIHPNDPQRILRALEVYQLTGKPLTELHQTTEKNPYAFINLAILPQSREKLHQRIAYRFKQMLAAGFIDEVRALHQCKEVHEHLPAIKSVGYRQVWHYLEGKIDYNEMIEKSIAATRQLAKRQLTWLRSWQPLEIFKSESSELQKDLFAMIKKHSHYFTK